MECYRMISRKGAYYPRLVREFYANMTYKSKSKKKDIKTKVKGVYTHLTRTTLANILSLPDEGNPIFLSVIPL